MRISKEEIMRIHFRNGSVPSNELVDVQGLGYMLAQDVPIGAFCWQIGRRRYFGMFDKCLWERI